MQSVWNRIEDAVERIDHYTYGAAEMLLVMVLGGTVAIGFHLLLSAVFYGYLQIFTLITGSF